MSDSIDLLAVALWLNGPLEISQAAIIRAPRLEVERVDDKVQGVIRLRARIADPERSRGTSGEAP